MTGARRIGALLVAAALSLTIVTGTGAHAAEAVRHDLPGPAWFFVDVGSAAPQLIRPDAYDGGSFSALRDKGLGR
jgi:hypothetical protein